MADRQVILLVDDEELVRMVVGRILEHAGFAVLSAASGPAGVALLREHAHEVGLVLLDVSMPGMSGPEALGRLREVSPAVKVILLSGGNRGDALDSLGDQAGPDAFLSKPFQIDKALAVIRRCLEGQ